MSYSRALLIAFCVFPCALSGQDRCDDPLQIVPGIYEGSTVGGEAGGRSSCGDSASSPAKWFRFTAETDCSVRVDTCGSEFDSVLSVQSVASATSDCSEERREISCADDTCGFQSRLVFAAAKGESFLIRLSGHRGAAGSYRMELSCSEMGIGDDCADAIDIEPGVHHGDTRGLTPDGATLCGMAGNSPDVWYRYTAETDCFLLASTCGSEFDTALSIHTDCPGNVLNQLTCNDDSCGLQSTASLAARAGETYLIRVAGHKGESGPYTLELTCGDPPTGDGPDLVVGDFDSLEQSGRVDGKFALSVRTILCNAGSAPVDWFGNPSPNHPFLVFNVYRLENDRIEQIGQSWVKHGIASSQNNSCGDGCVPFGNYQHLGVGCADIYSPQTNADRGNMGPRYEVNPWTGAFDFSGSYVERERNVPDSSYDDIALRLQLRDHDVDPSLHPDAEFFFELFVLSHDDIDRTNSLGFKEMTVSGEPGGEWELALVDSQTAVGPACVAWPNAVQTTFGQDSAGDGRCFVLAKTSDNGDGTWHYEYAVFNLDMSRGVGSFSVPVGPGTEIRNVGFHSPFHHGDGVSNSPWSSSRDGRSITWRTEDHAANPMANAVRWGTLYNFRFDASSPPMDASITLGVFAPTAFPTHSGPSVGPAFEDAPTFERGDADGNGSIEVTDAIFTLNFLFRGQRAPDCPNAADVNDSGRLDLNDGIYLLRWMFNNTGGIDSIGTGCTPDLTPSVLIPVTCEYPSCVQ